MSQQGPEVGHGCIEKNKRLRHSLPNPSKSILVQAKTVIRHTGCMSEYLLTLTAASVVSADVMEYSTLSQSEVEEIERELFVGSSTVETGKRLTLGLPLGMC